MAATCLGCGASWRRARCFTIAHKLVGLLVKHQTLCSRLHRHSFVLRLSQLNMRRPK